MIEHSKQIVLKAARHVRQTRAQRGLANQKIEQVKFTNSNNDIPVSQEQKVQTIVMDYCQNLSLPHLGADQLGDTYYFSPLSKFCFEIDNTVNNELTKHI